MALRIIELSDQKPLILIENTTRYYFYLRVIKTYQIKDFILLHSSFFTFWRAKKDGIKKNILLKGSYHTYNNYDCLENRINNTQYGFRGISSSVKNRIKRYIQKNKVLWIFNGNQYTAKSILFELKNCDFSIYFFEVGNFKSKVQIGLEGVNSKNLIYQNIHEYEVASPVKTRKIDYFSNDESKLSASLLVKLTEFTIDYILHKPLGTPVYPKKILRSINKIMGGFLCKLLFFLVNSKGRNPDSSFIFLGQVKNDTQLVMTNNNLYSLQIILEKALNICESNGKKMIYRFHPREYNLKAVIEVLNWCRKYNVQISNQGNLTDLSRLYAGFVTFNSTAGLQLIGENKKVYCIDPECYYRSWKKSDVDHFITKILVPVGES